MTVAEWLFGTSQYLAAFLAAWRIITWYERNEWKWTRWVRSLTKR